MNSIRRQICKNVQTYNKINSLNQKVTQNFHKALFNQTIQKQNNFYKSQTNKCLFRFSEAEKEAETEKKTEEQKPAESNKSEELPTDFYKLVDLKTDASLSQAKKMYKEMDDKVFQQNKNIQELKKKLELTEQATQDAQKKVNQLRDTLKAQDEETELVRKRLTKEREDQKVFAITKFAKEMLDTTDNLERAIENSKENKSFETLLEGTEMTYTILMQSLKRNNVVQVNPFKEKFDPNLHDCLMQVDDPNLEPGTVAFVIQSGYTINGRALRPARVGVVKDRPEEAKTEENKEEEKKE